LLQSWAVELLTLKAAEQIVASVAGTELSVLMAGHARKHNTCRAEIGGCVSGYTYISIVSELLVV